MYWIGIKNISGHMLIQNLDKEELMELVDLLLDKVDNIGIYKEEEK